MVKENSIIERNSMLMFLIEAEVNGSASADIPTVLQKLKKTCLGN